MMVVPVGPGPAPDYRWVGPAAAARIRARSAITGTAMLLWGVTAGTLTLLAGSRLPAADHPINGIGVLVAAVSALLLLGVAVVVLGTRRYAVGEHVDVAGGRVLGRIALALALYALGCAVLAAALLLMTARTVSGSPPGGGVGLAVVSYLLLPISCGVFAVIGGGLARRRLRAPLTASNGVDVTAPAVAPQPPPGHVWVPVPVAARIRRTMLRAGLGNLAAGALLVGVTVALVLTRPGANGLPDAITMSGGTTGAFLIFMAGIGLLNARHAVSGQAFLPGHARRIRQLLVVLWLLSLVMTAVIAYGAAAIPGGPVLASLLLPIGSCVLTGIAAVMARSVLTSAARGRS